MSKEADSAASASKPQTRAEKKKPKEKAAEGGDDVGAIAVKNKRHKTTNDNMGVKVKVRPPENLGSALNQSDLGGEFPVALVDIVIAMLLIPLSTASVLYCMNTVPGQSVCWY
jgi:hypothetical protein